jgi:cytochrome c peroxidase
MSRSRYARNFAHAFFNLTPVVARTVALGGSLSYLASPASCSPNSAPANVKAADYNKVAQDIANLLESNPDYDDGSYGPLFVRLAWHASGTFSVSDSAKIAGGSNGCLMRFGPQKDWGANAGLGLARTLLEKVKKENPTVSYADIYTLAGVVAIQSMGGPTIPWRGGRTDAVDGKSSPPDGRLPDATKKSQHLRDVFHRMGFNDKEIVALSGAHSLGRCHADRSGFVGP